jgi:hypothetical protein
MREFQLDDDQRHGRRWRRKKATRVDVCCYLLVSARVKLPGRVPNMDRACFVYSVGNMDSRKKEEG